MSRTVVIPAQTAAVTTGVEFDSSDVRATNIVVSATVLATTEEVDIELFAGAGWVIYSSGGTPVTLTAAQRHATLPAGPMYRFKKDATASACSVVVSWAPIPR